MDRRVVVGWTLLLMGLGSPLLAGCEGSEEPTAQQLAEQFVDERDRRVTQFCACFSDLLGYAAGDAASCIEGETFAPNQRGCIVGIFTPPDEQQPSGVVPDAEQSLYTSEPALECLIDAEIAYRECLVSLSCDDKDGLNACLGDFNASRQQCPRLSEEDEADFESCLLL